MPPERVIDVMALRGDSIDNIPGAPGIGDKGSVELIKRFGSVEQALDRAAEVEKKTYRESLQNNRDNILLSKKLVTIDCDVPIELDVNAMNDGRTGRRSAARSLYRTGVHFAAEGTCCPVVEVSEAHYTRSEIGRRCRSGAEGRSSRQARWRSPSKQNQMLTTKRRRKRKNRKAACWR